MAAQCLNPDDRILLYTPFNRNVISNGRVALSVFPLVDSMGSGAVEPDVYMLLFFNSSSVN